MLSQLRRRFGTRRRTIAGAVIVMLAAGGALPAGAAVLHGRVASNTALHLYVSQPQAHQILRFPLDRNGIPAQTPDGVITGLQGPSGLAIGPDNRLYVVDAVAEKLAIYEPSPGTGSTPSHVLHLPYTQGAGAVGVDGGGNVYVGYNFKCGEGSPCAAADVYHALPTGNAKPFATYQLGGSPPEAIATALVINAEHALAAVAAQQASIYTGAPHDVSQTPYPLFCPAIITFGGVWGPNQRELFLTDIGERHSPPQPSQIIVIPDYKRGQIPNCPASYPITSSTVPLAAPFGIATAGSNIYATSSYNKQFTSALVFVFDAKKPGAQKPLAIVSGPASHLSAPVALAVGP